MTRSRLGLACLLLAATSCLGSTLSLTGNFDTLGLDTQWDPFLAVFTTTAASDVVIQSFGYDGGTNARGQIIPAGGFDSIVAVFRGTGPGAVFLDLSDDGPFGLDPLLELPALPAGTYTMALTPYANYPWAWWDSTSYSTLGDGFIGLGSINNRTVDFAVDITSDALVTIPEPATFLLLGTAFLAIGSLKKRTQLWPGKGR